MPIDEELFKKEAKKTLDKVISCSYYSIVPDQLRYLLDNLSEVAYFNLSPEPYTAEPKFVQYHVRAFNSSNTEIKIDPQYELLKPSPPAK